jgi:hypothetical protein
MKKRPPKISTMQSHRQRFGSQALAQAQIQREERIGARELVKAQDPDSQNGQRGVENDRNEKITR